ncbi:MAG: YgfZ/GcvT domain-containing protein [Solirubrobacterales bacterium]
MERITATAEIEIDGQYRALREEAGLVLRPERGLLTVGGTEGAEYLQGQLTNEIEALGPGEGCYSALLDRKGKMQGDMRVLRIAADQILIETEPSALAAVSRHLGTYKIGREVEIEDIGSERAILSLIGPASSERAGTPPLVAEHAHATFERDGIGSRAVATDVGVDLIVAASEADGLRRSLLAAGLAEAGEEAAEIVRVENGRPRFGAEMTTETIPQEAGINERAISFEKGCYIGQETVARLHYKGKPNRHLRGLRLSAPVAAGAPVRLGERDAGRVGTAVLSPAFGPIALAILRREAEPGASVEVGEDGATAEVVEVPFERIT